MNYEIPKQTSVVRDTNGAGATGFVATNQGGHGYRMDRNTFEKHGNRETGMMEKKYFKKKNLSGMRDGETCDLNQTVGGMWESCCLFLDLSTRNTRNQARGPGTGPSFLGIFGYSAIRLSG